MKLPKTEFSEVATATGQEVFSDLFPQVAGRPGAAWLDSSMSFDDRGEYSFLAFNPEYLLLADTQGISLRFPSGVQRFHDSGDFWRQFSKLHREQNLFGIGYFGYEATLPFLGLKAPDARTNIPEAAFFFYKSALIFDHKQRLVYASNPAFDTDAILGKSILWAGGNPHAHRHHHSSFEAPNKQEYCDKIATIKRHIKEGDIYQANFTTRMEVRSEIPPFQVYQNLRELNPAPYGAFINFGDFQVISASPERQFKKQRSLISSAPIKGTIPRGMDSKRQESQLLTLLNSEKDRAELLMIVDLVRNDLGKIALPGTVRVEKMFKPEVYSSLIHLVADVSAELRPKVSERDIFEALLPGGSITGAPKKRAVEILLGLESTPRSVYTGGIGYVWGDRADFSIAIRTMTYQDGNYQIHAGGGIVADSDPLAEYDEMLLKARNLLKAVGVRQ